MASNTSNPTQIGYTPLGYTGLGSQVVIGRNTRSEWEAIGYGSGARPDILQQFVINLSYQGDFFNPVSADNPLATDTNITLNVADIVTAFSGNLANFPSTLSLKLTEVSVCEMVSGESREKRMIIIGSQTYLPSGES